MSFDKKDFNQLSEVVLNLNNTSGGLTVSEQLQEASAYIEKLQNDNKRLVKELGLLCDKLADIRDLFDESDEQAEGHGMEDAIGYPYAVVVYAENKMKRLMYKVERYEKVLGEIADNYDFNDVYSEVIEKRFIAKQALKEK